MEKEKKSIDSQTKISGKIKGIVVALLLALGSSNFSYSQENDLINKVDITRLESYEQFKKNELVRCLDLKERNSAFRMFVQLVTTDTRNGFAEFHDIDEELKNIFSQMPKDETYVTKLDEFLADLNRLYVLEKNVECRLAIAYMKSKISDEKIRFLDGINEPYELLKRQLRVGDIILLNKKNSPFDIGTKALKIYDEKYLTDFTHVLIFIGFDENGDILVRHSTTATENFHKIGVENTTLNSYIFDKDRSNAKGYDIVILRPDPTIVQSILKLSEEKLQSGYDNLSALRQGFGLNNTFNDKYNCVELVTQSVSFNEDEMIHFDDSWDYSFSGKLNKDLEKIYIDYMLGRIQEFSSKTFPNDLFEFLDLFTLVYSSHISK